MTSLPELKAIALKTLTGNTGHTSQLEIEWLESETGETGSLQELWHHFFDDNAIAAGPFSQRAAVYLKAEGYTGALPEMWAQFWAAGGPSEEGFLILESGDYLLLESGDKLLLE